MLLTNHAAKWCNDKCETFVANLNDPNIDVLKGIIECGADVPITDVITVLNKVLIDSAVKTFGYKKRYKGKKKPIPNFSEACNMKTNVGITMQKISRGEVELRLID